MENHVMASGATNIIPQVHLVIYSFKNRKKIGFEIYDGVNFEYLKIFGIFLGKPLKKLRTCLSGVFLCVV